MLEQPSSRIRGATQTDIPLSQSLDLAYETEYVWQIDMRDENGAIALSFHTARLPRQMQVVPPRHHQDMTIALARGDVVLVAEENDTLSGYLIMRVDEEHNAAWVSTLGVHRPKRRAGVGTALLAEAYQHAGQIGLRRFVVETQSKNYPAICFCQKHGLIFCGYGDRFYPNNDIALFFGQNIRNG
jgi:ribosomal protein S18 acetylase RimI-like enzyme